MKFFSPSDRANSLRDKLYDIGEKTQAVSNHLDELGKAPGTTSLINSLTKDIRTSNDWPGEAQKRSRKVVRTAFANNLDTIQKIQKYIVAGKSSGTVIFFMPENIVLTNHSSRVTRLKYDEIVEIYNVGGSPKEITLRTANAARKSRETTHINADTKKVGKQIMDELNFRISSL